MSYHRVSPEGTKDPWFQDERTGMFFQFFSTDWSQYEPWTPTPAATARYLLHRYGSPYRAWVGHMPNWHTEDDADG